MGFQQASEKLTVIMHSKMQKFMHDDVVLKAARLTDKVTAKRDTPTG